MGAHKDPGALTLLLVEPDKGGLQVEYDGAWIDVPPVEDAFVVNIGELMEFATDGYLKATLHSCAVAAAGQRTAVGALLLQSGIELDDARVSSCPPNRPPPRPGSPRIPTTRSREPSATTFSKPACAPTHVAARHHADLLD